MKEIIKYVAFDDTMFDDELECRAYEIQKQLTDITDLQIFDFDGNPINIVDVSIYDRACFINIPNDGCLDFIHEVSETYGADLPDEKGFWIYNDDSWAWDNIEELNKKLEPFRKINNLLEKCGMSRLTI